MSALGQANDVNRSANVRLECSLRRCSNCKRPIAQNKTAPGGDTGAVSRARRLLSAAERHLVDGIDQPIATFVERVRQQVRVLRNLAMDALQTRLYERIHEAGRRGHCAAPRLSRAQRFWRWEFGECHK